MLGVPMMRTRKSAGRPRTIHGRTTRQVSLCSVSEDKASQMHNFSAFVRGCLIGRSEGQPESSTQLIAVVENRLYAQGFDTELKQWKSSEEEQVHQMCIDLINALKAL